MDVKSIINTAELQLMELLKVPVKLELVYLNRRQKVEMSDVDMVNAVQVLVAEVYEIPLMHMRSACRKHPYPDARTIGMVLVRNELNLPLKLIGLYFGGKDHSTVIHAINYKFAEQIEVDANFKRKYEKCVAKLESIMYAEQGAAE